MRCEPCCVVVLDRASERHGPTPIGTAPCAGDDDGWDTTTTQVAVDRALRARLVDEKLWLQNLFRSTEQTRTESNRWLAGQAGSRVLGQSQLFFFFERDRASLCLLDRTKCTPWAKPNAWEPARPATTPQRRARVRAYVHPWHRCTACIS